MQAMDQNKILYLFVKNLKNKTNVKILNFFFFFISDCANAKYKRKNIIKINKKYFNIYIKILKILLLKL